MKPAFLDRCRGWRRSALLTYKMNIFGKIFNCRSDVAVAVLSLMSRCRSRRLSFSSRRSLRRRRRLGPETSRKDSSSAEFHVRPYVAATRAIKNVLHANTLSTKSTQTTTTCRAYYLSSLEVERGQLLVTSSDLLSTLSKSHQITCKIYVTRDKSKYSKLKKTLSKRDIATILFFFFPHGTRTEQQQEEETTTVTSP